jgi:formylglycine-generating enzyme required for sulfatase activity
VRMFFRRGCFVVLLVAAAMSFTSPLRGESTRQADDGYAVPGLNPGHTRLLKELGIRFVRIMGGELIRGEFRRGQDNGEEPQRVRIEDFYLSATEITQQQWSRLKANSSFFKGCPDCPVENVRFHDIFQFLYSRNWSGLSLRIPTEYEWEYAASGGEPLQGWSGTNEKNDLGNYAWLIGNSGDQTHPVGEKEPNRFGLHDMTGNVWEICAVGEWKYTSEQELVFKGGSIFSDPDTARIPASDHYKSTPGEPRMNIGFRVVLDVERSYWPR